MWVLANLAYLSILSIPCLWFMLNAWLHVRVINFRIIIIILLLLLLSCFVLSYWFIIIIIIIIITITHRPKVGRDIIWLWRGWYGGSGGSLCRRRRWRWSHRVWTAGDGKTRHWRTVSVNRRPWWLSTHIPPPRKTDTPKISLVTRKRNHILL